MSAINAAIEAISRVDDRIINQLEAEVSRLRDALRNARRCVAENPDPRHALAIIDAALTPRELAKNGAPTHE